MSKDDDEARKLILARRARFLAGAVAGIGIACGDAKSPQPCLEPPAEPPGAEPPPMVCLSIAIPQPAEEAGAPDAAPAGTDPTSPAAPDAGSPTGSDGGPSDAGTKKPGAKKPVPPGSPTTPMPCLSVAPKTKPGSR